MNLEKYVFDVKPDSSFYGFYSEGVKGRIKKVVVYSVVPQLGDNVFNLGFGDWNEEKQDIDDLVVTDNGDRDKVLATVAGTIKHFINLNPSAIIFIQGSSPSRTRLYQISISIFYQEIEIDFRVYGYYNEEWVIFTKGKNYNAFLVVPK